MGYYSQVSILMDKESADDFIKKLAKELPKHIGFYSKALEEGFKIFGIDETKPYRIFHFDWIKWYEMFPEVKFMMDFLKEIEEPHFYDFVRLGEETDDIEQMNNVEYYFNIEVNVTLEQS